MLEKAKIIVLEKCEMNGITFAANTELPVMFNPSSYSLEHESKYKVYNLVRNKKASVVHEGPKPARISLELLYDAEYFRDPSDDSQTANVLGFTQPIVALTQNDIELNRPPYIRFSWGGDYGLQFSGFMESVSENHQQFNRQGASTRSMLRISIIAVKEVDGEEQGLHTKPVYESAADSAKDMNKRLKAMQKADEYSEKQQLIDRNDDVSDILSKLEA